LTEARTLQSIIDPFVKGVGGELVCDLVGNSNPPSSADYLFRRNNVIAELKSLQGDGFVESFSRKIGDLIGKWDRQRRVRVYGTTQVSSNQLSPECSDEMFDVISESLQKHIVGAANNQIKSTKRILGIPDARGLLWVASDGNEYLQPNVVWYLLTRILQKKKGNGDPAFSSIHGLAYFNPRMLARVPQATEPAILWFSGCRQPEPQLAACLSDLSTAWPQYVTWAHGVPVRQVGGAPEDARFFGPEARMPRVTAHYK